VGTDAAETVNPFRITVNIQTVPLTEIKDLVVSVDFIYRVTIYFTEKLYMICLTLQF
jgi:hypothetical protein